MYKIIKSREFAVYLTGVIGGITIAEYYFKVEAISIIASTLREWAVIIASFTMIYGTYYLIRHQMKLVYKRERGKWYYGLIMITFFSLMFLSGIVGESGRGIYSFLFNDMLAPMWIAVYAQVICFTASAIFRTFRVKSTDSLALVCAALIVLLANAPIGALLWSGIPSIAEWVNTYFSNAGLRAIAIGSGIALFVLGYRTLMGKERGALGGV